MKKKIRAAKFELAVEWTWEVFGIALMYMDGLVIVVGPLLIGVRYE